MYLDRRILMYYVKMILLNLNSKRMISRIFYLMISGAKLEFTLSCSYLHLNKIIHSSIINYLNMIGGRCVLFYSLAFSV